VAATIQRVLALLRARLAAQFHGELLHAPALMSHGTLAAVLCLLVRDVLGPFGYALFALSASAGLVALSLLGDLGGLLRRDPVAEWSETLPARALERRAAQAAAILLAIGGLSLAVLVPAALLAPPEAGAGARALLVAAGVGQAFLIAAALLALQALLGERAEGLLVLVQTALVACAIGGVLACLRIAPWLGAVAAGRAPWPAGLGWLPPAWLARSLGPAPEGAALPPVWAGPALALAAVALLLAVTPASPPAGRRSTTVLGRLLAPARALAARAWVRREERGPFELVYAALPMEREFVLRTYPMVGIPLAFLLIGARAEAGPQREGLLALLLFTPAVYLPVLLAHVPATASPGARWILDAAPVRAAAVRGGAIKALAVRFLIPLYLCLGALSATLGEGALALRLALPGALVSLAVMRILYPRVVLDAPLSTATDELEVRHDWVGLLLTLVFALVGLALFAQVFVDTWPRALGLTALLLGLELLLDRRESVAEPTR